jgi:hypothetical protein
LTDAEIELFLYDLRSTGYKVERDYDRVPEPAPPRHHHRDDAA